MHTYSEYTVSVCLPLPYYPRARLTLDHITRGSRHICLNNPSGIVGQFQATDKEHGAELWKTDGTGAGTVLVKDVYPGEKSGACTSFVPFGDYLYFQVGSSRKITGMKLL